MVMDEWESQIGRKTDCMLFLNPLFLKNGTCLESKIENKEEENDTLD